MTCRYLWLLGIVACTQSQEPPVEPALHRDMAVACAQDRPRPEVFPNGGLEECDAHEDCTDGLEGRCIGTRAGNQCTYHECLEDSDCEEGVCECGGGFASDHNVCLPGNCRVDADCDGNYCSPSFGSCGNYQGNVAYYCHTADDECVDDADCTGAAAYCAWNAAGGRWTCQDSHCVG